MGDATESSSSMLLNSSNDHSTDIYLSSSNYLSHSKPESSSSSSALDSSNLGFQLLKKQGWQEGTGLGASQQGRLEPVETYIKKNKRGLGAEKVKKKTVKAAIPVSDEKGEIEKKSKKAKAISKKMRKMLNEEKQWQEKESERAFFREFWPDNV